MIAAAIEPIDGGRIAVDAVGVIALEAAVARGRVVRLGAEGAHGDVILFPGKLVELRAVKGIHLYKYKIIKMEPNPMNLSRTLR